MTALLLSLCVAMALFAIMGLLLLTVMGDQSQMEARLMEVTSLPSEEVAFSFRDLLSYLTRMTRPVRGLVGLKADSALALQLGMAGYREPEDVDTFLNAKLLGPVVGVLLGTFAPRGDVLLACLFLGALGFFTPDLFLIRAIKRYKDAIARSMPDAMDLLVICMEAGLGMDQAMMRVGAELAPVYPQLSDELNILAREQRAGKPRIEAWRNMADKLDVDIVSQFAGMLVQSERLGTPIARSLGQFADSMRTKRLMDSEERAAKVSIKMIPPMVLFIFPAMFVVILGPSIIRLEQAFQ